MDKCLIMVAVAAIGFMLGSKCTGVAKAKVDNPYFMNGDLVNDSNPTIARYENKEAVCYVYVSNSISCFKKQ